MLTFLVMTFWCTRGTLRLWLKFLSFRGLCCLAAVTPHAQWGLWGRRTTGEVGWDLGQSGALSLQGWLKRNGIDGVVMRDWDVREQTPIQSGTSKRGLLGNSGAHHHLGSLDWRAKTGGGKNREKGRLSNRVHTHRPTMGLLFWCVTWASCSGVYRRYSMCPCKMLWVNYFSMLPKWKTTSQCTYVCHSSRLWRNNNKPSWFPRLKGMTFQITAPKQAPQDILRADTQKYETDMNQSAKVIPGTQRETAADTDKRK